MTGRQSPLAPGCPRRPSLTITAPTSDAIASRADLRDWVGRHGFPLVLKTDGSWGGRGVAIVRKPALLPVGGAGSRARPACPERPSACWSIWRPARSSRGPAAPARWSMSRRSPVAGRPSQPWPAWTARCSGSFASESCRRRRNAGRRRRRDHRPSQHGRSGPTVGRCVRSERLLWLRLHSRRGRRGVALELNPRVTPTGYLLVDGDFVRERTFALFPLDPSLCGDAKTAALCDRPVRAPALTRHGDRVAVKHDFVARRAVRNLRYRMTREK